MRERYAESIRSSQRDHLKFFERNECFRNQRFSIWSRAFKYLCCWDDKDYFKLGLRVIGKIWTTHRLLIVDHIYISYFYAFIAFIIFFFIARANILMLLFQHISPLNVMFCYVVSTLQMYFNKTKWFSNITIPRKYNEGNFLAKQYLLDDKLL